MSVVSHPTLDAVPLQIIRWLLPFKTYTTNLILSMLLLHFIINSLLR